MHGKNILFYSVLIESHVIHFSQENQKRKGETHSCNLIKKLLNQKMKKVQYPSMAIYMYMPCNHQLSVDSLASHLLQIGVFTSDVNLHLEVTL